MAKRKKPGILAEFSMRLTIAMVIVIAGCVLMGLYIYYPNQQEDIKFAGILVAGLATVYSAFYVGSRLRHQARTRAIGLSLEFMDSLHTYELTKLRVAFEEEFDSDSISPAELYAKISSDTDTHATVRFMLNRFEAIAIAIQRGVADEETLYMSLSFLVPFWMKKYQPFIEETRRRLEDPFLYICAERLASSWKSGVYFSDGMNVVENF